MAIYVDDADIRWKGLSLWYHMTGDDAEELHQMAQAIGLKKSYFQGDHYDITAGKRVMAIKKGAIMTNQRRMAQLRRQFVEEGVFDE